MEKKRRIRLSSEKRLLRSATWASLVVSGVLILLKGFAWLSTGSVAMLGSLADSALDFIASLGIFYSLRISQTGTSSDYRFGRGKAEAVAAFVQAGLIGGSALFVLEESVSRALSGVEVRFGYVGILVSGFAFLATLGLVIYQRYVLSRAYSLAIKADSMHYVTDLLGNAGVMVALLLSQFGLGWADPVAGFGIALWLLWSGWLIVRESLGVLLDRELSDTEREQIVAVVDLHREVLSVSGLRTRQAGSDKFIELTVALDGNMRLYRSHAVMASLKADLEVQFPGSDVVIRLAPYGSSFEGGEAHFGGGG
ncbi:MAG: cation diffusion facilitator family transporter [Alphaproteobacteria bacterium]